MSESASPLCRIKFLIPNEGSVDDYAALYHKRAFYLFGGNKLTGNRHSETIAQLKITDNTATWSEVGCAIVFKFLKDINLYNPVINHSAKSWISKTCS